MTTEIQQNRYDQLLRRVGGLIGPGSKVSEVLSELFPVLDVENIPGELLRLGGIRLGMGAQVMPAVSAEIGKIQLFNPADSGLLVTLTTIICTVSTADQEIRFAVVNSALTTNVGNTPFRDTRDGVALSTVAQVRSLSSAAGIGRHFAFFALKNVPQQFNDSNGIVVLAPGTGLTIATGATDRQLTVGFMWRERVAERSELNL